MENSFNPRFRIHPTMQCDAILDPRILHWHCDASMGSGDPKIRWSEHEKVWDPLIKLKRGNRDWEVMGIIFLESWGGHLCLVPHPMLHVNAAESTSFALPISTYQNPTGWIMVEPLPFIVNFQSAGFPLGDMPMAAILVQLRLTEGVHQNSGHSVLPPEFECHSIVQWLAKKPLLIMMRTLYMGFHCRLSWKKYFILFRLWRIGEKVATWPTQFTPFWLELTLIISQSFSCFVLVRSAWDPPSIDLKPIWCQCKSLL